MIDSALGAAVGVTVGTGVEVNVGGSGVYVAVRGIIVSVGRTEEAVLHPTSNPNIIIAPRHKKSFRRFILPFILLYADAPNIQAP